VQHRGQLQATRFHGPAQGRNRQPKPNVVALPSRFDDRRPARERRLRGVRTPDSKSSTQLAKRDAAGDRLTHLGRWSVVTSAGTSRRQQSSESTIASAAVPAPIPRPLRRHRRRPDRAARALAATDRSADARAPPCGDEVRAFGARTRSVTVLWRGPGFVSLRAWSCSEARTIADR
jgi:hypothetical protein